MAMRFAIHHFHYENQIIFTHCQKYLHNMINN